VSVRINSTIALKARFQGKATSSREVIWDADLAGFGLRVYPSGRKAWVLQYSFGSARRLLVLGRYPTLTVKQAREAAIEKLGAIHAGADPVRTKKEARRAPTVADLCQRYVEEQASHKKSGPADERRIDTYIKPHLGELRVVDVKRDDVLGLYRRVGSRKPYEANRLLALLSSMFNLAREWGVLPEGALNPAKISARSRYPERRRDRPVTSEELPRLLKAIHSEPDVYVRTAFLLLLASGLRKREILHAKHSNVDLERGTLRLADTKAGQPRHVPLSEHAVGLFRGLPRRLRNDYVFPSPVRAGAPRGDLFKPWDRIRKAAGCPGLRIHDLRHTVATLLAERGNAAHVVQGVLGHQSLATTMRYIHAVDRGQRRALDELGDVLLGGVER
jgi:integrase